LTAPLAVEPGSEYGDDGEDVFREFLLVGDWSGVGVGVNNDGRVVLVEDVFDEVKRESAESVPVSDVYSSEPSLESKSEKAPESLSLEVESARDVTEDICVGVGDLEDGELSLEVWCLLTGADPSVHGVDAVRFVHSSFSDSCFVDCFSTMSPRGSSGDVEERLSGSSGTKAFDVSLVGPLL
jgi:hypothetical protein